MQDIFVFVVFSYDGKFRGFMQNFKHSTCARGKVLHFYRLQQWQWVETAVFTPTH